ncbi:MAG: holo-[acyl-carrier-protein] synthase, partial [Pseudomonadota bacterium]
REPACRKARSAHCGSVARRERCQRLNRCLRNGNQHQRRVCSTVFSRQPLHTKALRNRPISAKLDAALTLHREPTMILGIGNDMIDIGRIERSLARFGDRFLDRVFTAEERRRSDKRAGRAASYAKRFAAKEACAKALGTGLRRGVFWRDMGVVNLPSGQPTMKLTGGAAARLAAITPKGYEARIALTLTDDNPWAQAIVIISAEPIAK